jgi:hypothetical protein
MLQPSEDEEVMNRTAEVASAVAEQYLQAGGESVPDRFARERRGQLRDGRHAVDRNVLASNGQPPS